jgi:hypothetical protein
VTGQRPVAISDEAMAVLFDLARPLDPRDRTRFVEAVVAELNGHAEIDVWSTVLLALCSTVIWVTCGAPARRGIELSNKSLTPSLSLTTMRFDRACGISRQQSQQSPLRAIGQPKTSRD